MNKNNLNQKMTSEPFIQITASGIKNLENPIPNLLGLRYKNRRRQEVLVVDQ